MSNTEPSNHDIQPNVPQPTIPETASAEALSPQPLNVPDSAELPESSTPVVEADIPVKTGSAWQDFADGKGPYPHHLT